MQSLVVVPADNPQQDDPQLLRRAPALALPVRAVFRRFLLSHGLFLWGLDALKVDQLY